MGDPVKILISASIKSLEQGAFQDFCLSFLPIFHSNFIGLERHGGTAEGKTRAGTPDLIKTFPDASHICVQCSAEKDYWSKPANVDDWKPVKDIMKCVHQIASMREIMLCCSQEIPTNLPNVKAEILQCGKKITSAEISILSLSNFEEELISNKDGKYSETIKKHLPHLYDLLLVSSRALIAETTLDLYKKLPAPLSIIENVVKDFVREGAGKDVENIQVEISKTAKSRFQRIHASNSGLINRDSVNDFLSRNNIFGKVYSIMGVPKIGKTNWVLKLCESMEKVGFETDWFDAPEGQFEQAAFLRDFKRVVLGKIIGFEIANQYTDNKIGIHELTSFLRQAKVEIKYLVVVDNVEQLTPDSIVSLKELIELIKNTTLQSIGGIILISNKKIKKYFGNIAIETYCPIWNSAEIEQLLAFSKVAMPDDRGKYCELLASMSSGHPLVALSLARRAPRIIDLLPFKPSNAPALEDEDLTEEVKQILFNDLLSDGDHRDLVLRLSVLIYRVDLEQMQAVIANIEPALRTPIKLMLENLKGLIIEGDENTGYQVAFVFKQVAKNYLSIESTHNIYDRMAVHLMTPKNKVVNANDALNAIVYALLAAKFHNAFSWTSMLLYQMMGKSFTVKQKKYLLSRLNIIEFLNFPNEKDLKAEFYTVLFILSGIYSLMDEFAQANQILNRLVENPLNQDEIPSRLPVTSEQLKTTVQIKLIVNFAASGDYDSALNILDKCDVPAFLEMRSKMPKEINFLHLLIQNAKTINFPNNFMKRLVNLSAVDDNLILGELAESFADLGVIAYKEKDSLFLEKMLEDSRNDPKWSLFIKIAYAQYKLEAHDSNKSLDVVQELRKIIDSLKINSIKLFARILLIEGDSFYQIKNLKEAFTKYSSVIDLLPYSKNTFDYAWASYRAGMSVESNADAIKYFNEASKSFEKLKAYALKAKSDGERAVALYQLGNVTEAIDIIVDLADGYYLQNIKQYAPSITVGLAAVTRLRHEIKHEAFEERPTTDKVWPKLERGIFSNVLDIVQPASGVCSAFFIFSDVYKTLQKKDARIGALRIAFQGSPLNEAEGQVRIACALELMGLLVEENDERGAMDIVKALFADSLSFELPNKRPTLYHVFSKLDELKRANILTSQTYRNLLKVIEDCSNAMPDAKKYWWLADVFKRKAGMDGVTESKGYDFRLLKKSWEYAVRSSNYEVMFDVGQQLGFKHVEKANSIEEIAKIQLSVVLGICSDGGEILRLEIVGQNLTKIWNAIIYRRLTETDLKYWNNLHDRIKRILAHNTPENLHAPLMILFLLIVNKVENAAEYKSARNWAIDRLKNNLSAIPDDDYKYIEHTFK